jgi:hypothetical protein
MWILLDPMATTTASRTDTDVADKSGIKYLKRVLAVTFLSAEAGLEDLRVC